MIKLKSILLNESILISRRSKEERLKFYRASTYRKIRKYIRGGCIGDLDLRGAPVEYLPKELKCVEGGLYLNWTQIKRLPDGLEIKGDLWMDRCPFEEYPTNVKIGGSVDISRTNISKLPDNLTIDGVLYIWSTQISEIPNNLNIKEDLYCYVTPLSRKYTPEEIKQIIIDKGGSVVAVNK